MSIHIDNFFRTFKISSAGLALEKKQLAITAENIANATTTRTLEGTPYRRKELVREVVSNRQPFSHELRSANLRLQARNSGHISESRYQSDLVNRVGSSEIKSEVAEMNQFKRIYEPEHPDADADGYVNFPDINIVSEMLELISASRSYEANVTVMTATKSLARKALEI